MSSDPKRSERRARAFHRRLVGTLVVLASIAAGLGVVGAIQGPRVVNAEIDASRATKLVGLQLTLTLDQAVSALDEDDVEVDPAASATATAQAGQRTVVVTFDEPLDYATEYTVRVPGVLGAGPVAGAVAYSFETPDEEVWSLVRRSDRGEDDLVQRSSLANPAPEVVISASRIQEFARVDDILAVATIDDAGRNSLLLSQGDQAQPIEVGLPDEATIRDLAASTTNPLMGFVLDTPSRDGVKEYEAVLMTMDLSGAVAADPSPVLGLDGEPLRVSNWLFVPGTTSMVVQDFDGSLFLIDALRAQPITPLGVHTEIRGFIPGTTRLVIADPDRGAIIDLADGSTTTLDLAPADLADNVYPGHVTVLDDTHRYLINLVQADVENLRNRRKSTLAEVGREGQLSEVFAPALETSIIREYCLSPNGRYVAVSVSAQGSRPDGYSANPGFTETTTTIVELASDRTVMSMPGGFSDWCAP